MSRSLWVQKLSDEHLRKMLECAQDFEASGVVRWDKVWHILETWYDQKVGIERAMEFCVDVWKEAAFRWEKRLRDAFSG